MKTILKQIKNEWNSNLFLFVELLLVFVVLWYIVDWTLVTARVYHAPMGFDTEHCYNITVSKLGEDSPLYNPELTMYVFFGWRRTFSACSVMPLRRKRSLLR